MTNISPDQLHTNLQQNPKLNLLDVRTSAEYDSVHATGTTLLPLDRLNATALLEKCHFPKDQPLYIFCHSGTRAKLAAAQLEKEGYQQCHVVEGGTESWIQSGFPVTRGTRQTISLERQVRIAAGTLVLSGLLLAHGIHPSFLWLSGFVGGGLIFAGITDWCGMGLLLARMPWNQVKS